MKHKKEHHPKEKHHKGSGHSKMGMVQPMAHGGDHLKSMKKGHKSVSGK